MTVSFLCILHGQNWSYLPLPPVSFQLLGVLSADRYHLLDPPGLPELQGCLTQGYPLPGADHMQWLLQVRLPRPSYFNPMWDNSNGHFSSRDPCGFSSACWAIWLLPVLNPASFSFLQRLLSVTPLNECPVHWTASPGSQKIQPMTPTTCPRQEGWKYLLRSPGVYPTHWREQRQHTQLGESKIQALIIANIYWPMACHMMY